MPAILFKNHELNIFWCIFESKSNHSKYFPITSKSLLGRVVRLPVAVTAHTYNLYTYCEEIFIEPWN